MSDTCAAACPKELQVDRGAGTSSAYSSVFKTACPRAYSYAYDDGSSTFTCGNAADYTVAFCLPPSG